MKTNKISPLHSSTGFTLLEIMLVVGIIGLLLGVVAYSLTGYLNTGERTRVGTDIHNIEMALNTYRMANFNYPTTQQGISALVEKPGSEPVPRNWQPLLDKMPMDPWGESYKYEYPGKHNANKFDLYSKGPDRQEGTSDDIGNWE